MLDLCNIIKVCVSYRTTFNCFYCRVRPENSCDAAREPLAVAKFFVFYARRMLDDCCIQLVAALAGGHSLGACRPTL